VCVCVCVGVPRGESRAAREGACSERHGGQGPRQMGGGAAKHASLEVRVGRWSRAHRQRALEERTHTLARPIAPTAGLVLHAGRALAWGCAWSMTGAWGSPLGTPFFCPAGAPGPPRQEGQPEAQELRARRCDALRDDTHLLYPENTTRRARGARWLQLKGTAVVDITTLSSRIFLPFTRERPIMHSEEQSASDRPGRGFGGRNCISENLLQLIVQFQHTTMRYWQVRGRLPFIRIRLSKGKIIELTCSGRST